MIDDFYDGLGKLPGLTECVLLNTCNRTEIYGASKDNFSLDYIHNYLSEFRQLDPEFLKMYSYRRSGEEVVRHLFEVTSGIDSQMVGETEILGQVKKAYEEARSSQVFRENNESSFSKRFSSGKVGSYAHGYIQGTSAIWEMYYAN